MQDNQILSSDLSDMQQVNHRRPLCKVKRSPKMDKGKFVRIFDELTRVWSSPAWRDYVANSKNRTNI